MPKVTRADMNAFRAAIDEHLKGVEDQGCHDRDAANLGAIADWVEEGKLSLAMSVAAKADTILRDLIPARIWLAMGGEVKP